ncbi:unnamed protein product [Coregonus sp. 'balchen']|nr:unnamed protein product [Coregonus sp. 'balchen']
MAGSSNKYTVTEALLIVTDESWTPCIPIDSESDDEDLLRPDEPDPNEENEGCRVQGPTQASEDEDYRGDEPEHLPPQPQLPLPQAEPALPQPGRLSRRCTSAPLPRQRSSSDIESPVKSPQPKRKGKAFSKSVHPSKCGRGRPATPRVGEEEEEEEDRWHNREENDEQPDPIRFMPTRVPGPTIDTTASWSPLSLFQLFFSTSVVRTIICNTNANAAKRLQSGLKFAWIPLTMRDLYILLAILLYSGLTKTVPVPDAVADYNRSMGGVDLSDALVGYYSVHHKTMKWYKTFLFHFVDIAVNNPTKPYTHKKFREKLLTEMVSFAKQSEPQTPPRPTSCMPEYYAKRKNCRRCLDVGIPKVKTPVYCRKCQVPLCLTSKRNCFKDWHNSKF